MPSRARSVIGSEAFLSHRLVAPEPQLGRHYRALALHPRANYASASTLLEVPMLGGCECPRIHGWYDSAPPGRLSRRSESAIPRIRGRPLRRRSSFNVEKLAETIRPRSPRTPLRKGAHCRRNTQWSFSGVGRVSRASSCFGPIVRRLERANDLRDISPKGCRADRDSDGIRK
jgi:hypothetical protein